MKRRIRWIPVGLLSIAFALSGFAGEIEQYYRNRTDQSVPVESDWRQDARLQDHGITEIAFERSKSLDKTRWDSYSVAFYSDGRVEYAGHDFVRNLGEHVGRIPTQEFHRLVLLIQEMRFEEFEVGYIRFVPNSPTTYTSVVRNGVRTTVQNQADAGPMRLWAIELAIQDLVRKITWES
jgi:hypothetical protein